MKTRNITAMLFPVFVSCLAITVVAVPPFSDDFNDGNDNGWIRHQPLNGTSQGGAGTWSFPSGAYRLFVSPATAPASTGPARVGAYRTNLFAEFVAQMDIVQIGSDLDEIFGVLGRTRQPGLGTTDGYALTYSTLYGRAASGLLEILRITDERGTTIASFNITFTPGHVYRMVLSGMLTQLKGELYDTTTNSVTPVVTLNATDATYTSGYSGIFVYDNSPTGNHAADLTIDNFVATLPQARLNYTVDAINQALVISWPSWAASYELEQSFTLPDWFSSNADVQLIGNYYTRSIGFEDKSFFRLVSH